MKTDDLIRVLAADTTPVRPLFPALLWAVFGPTVALGALFLWITGIRADLSAAFLAPVTTWKWILPACIAAAGIGLARRLSRPGAFPGRLQAFLWSALAIGVVLVSAQMAVLPAGQWAEAAKGQTRGICLTSIIGIGLPGLAAALVILKRGATTRPHLAGMAAGLGSAGVSATLYALHCNQDDPLYFVTWYGAAIAILGLAGALLGTRVLRW